MRLGNHFLRRPSLPSLTLRTGSASCTSRDQAIGWCVLPTLPLYEFSSPLLIPTLPAPILSLPLPPPPRQPSILFLSASNHPGPLRPGPSVAPPNFHTTNPGPSDLFQYPAGPSSLPSTRYPFLPTFVSPRFADLPSSAQLSSSATAAAHSYSSNPSDGSSPFLERPQLSSSPAFGQSSSTAGPSSQPWAPVSGVRG